MAKQIINNGETGLVTRTKLNDNFIELYNKDTSQDAVIGNNTTDITALDGRVTVNEGAITALDTRVTAVENSHTVLLQASSTALTQEPTTTDTALQVEFGVAQVTTDIDISAAGAITFKTAGKYIISPFFQYGRTGGVGTSILLNRYLRNGVQEGGSLAAKVDNADTLVPWSSSIQFTAAVNDVLTIEIIRDSTGSDSGGLFAVNPTPVGWANAPCAAIQIYKAT
jgi:hypothetical protein